jgi:transcriptional regulator with XRE-family HTH domain
MSEVDAVFERDAMTELALEALEESDESAHTYLVYSWLSSALEKLYDARRQANLTQRDVAQRLGTKQPAIARLERDNEGRVSLHRYIEFALACGFLPLDISLRPIEALREYALNDPDAPRTEVAFEAWSSKALATGNVIPPTHFDEVVPDVLLSTTNLWTSFEEVEDNPADDEPAERVAATVERALEETVMRKFRDTSSGAWGKATSGTTRRRVEVLAA